MKKHYSSAFVGGGKLFEPKTPETNFEVNKLAKAQGVNAFWLGINDTRNEGNFVYNSDGKAIGWTNWASGEPNNMQWNEDCVQIAQH